MDRAESKYSNTARRMDRAFLDLLDRKDFAYITVKELCQAAGVNRSTFYLHYETMGDLLSESVEAIMSEFLDYMQRDTGKFIRKLRDCPREELYLITPEYLTPYLSFIREHQRLMQTALAHAATLGLEKQLCRPTAPCDRADPGPLWGPGGGPGISDGLLHEGP